MRFIFRLCRYFLIRTDGFAPVEHKNIKILLKAILKMDITFYKIRTSLDMGDLYCSYVCALYSAFELEIVLFQIFMSLCK